MVEFTVQNLCDSAGWHALERCRAEGATLLGSPPCPRRLVYLIKYAHLLPAELHELRGHELLGFVCECGELECTERIELTDSEYRHVRADGATFALKIGHEKPDFEEILERAERFVVVHKFGVAGLIAEQRAPNA